MTFLADSATAIRESPAVRVWRFPNYRLFMSGLGCYYVTSWMQRVGVGWLAWELSHSHAWVGAIAAADLIPLVVLGPFRVGQRIAPPHTVSGVPVRPTG